MIISILNQKGGVGKTTLAVNIARCYRLQAKETLLVDSDTQGSAFRWHERSNELGIEDLIDITCLPGSTLDKDVMKFAPHYDRIIIDGIPSVSPVTACAIKAADIILIPVQPSPYDIWATEDLVKTVHYYMNLDGFTKAFFVVSRKIVGTNIGDEIYEELRKLELPVFKNGTSQRVAYATSVEQGLTVLDGEYIGSPADTEIRKIVAELEES